MSARFDPCILRSDTPLIVPVIMTILLQCDNRMGASRMLHRMANSGIYSPDPGDIGDIDEPKNVDNVVGGVPITMSDEGNEEQQFSFDM